MTKLIDSLRNAIGTPYVLTATADVAPYLRDWRGRYEGAARRSHRAARPPCGCG